MGNDGVSTSEIERSVLSGRIVRTQRDVHGRRRYTIDGGTREGRRIRLVCRYDDAGERVIVITVYEVTED